MNLYGSLASQWHQIGQKGNWERVTALVSKAPCSPRPGCDPSRGGGARGCAPTGGSTAPTPQSRFWGSLIHLEVELYSGNTLLPTQCWNTRALSGGSAWAGLGDTAGRRSLAPGAAEDSENESATPKEQCFHLRFSSSICLLKCVIEQIDITPQFK